jgi:2-oxo-4-hydroxy-4-carboxy--5-ureidoimidazoline (OHCU) decarboxylase
MTFVDDKINELPPEQRRKFKETLSAVFEEDTWMAQRGFDNCNYSPDMVRLTLYREMYEKDFSRLH